MWTITPTTTTKTNHFRHQHHPLEASRVCAKGTEHWDVACEKIGCWLGVFLVSQVKRLLTRLGHSGNGGIFRSKCPCHQILCVFACCFNARFQVIQHALTIPALIPATKAFQSHLARNQPPADGWWVNQPALSVKSSLLKVATLSLIMTILLWKMGPCNRFLEQGHVQMKHDNFQSNLWKFSNPESSKINKSAYHQVIFTTFISTKMARIGQDWRILVSVCSPWKS